jgi:hypothetical protein
VAVMVMVLVGGEGGLITEVWVCEC